MKPLATIHARTQRETRVFEAAAIVLAVRGVVAGKVGGLWEIERKEQA